MNKKGILLEILEELKKLNSRMDNIETQTPAFHYQNKQAQQCSSCLKRLDTPFVCNSTACPYQAKITCSN